MDRAAKTNNQLIILALIGGAYIALCSIFAITVGIAYSDFFFDRK